MSIVAYIWPIALVVMANTVYQVCAKSMPGNINPLAALTVTYMTACLSSLFLYLALNRGGGSLLSEYTKLNWVPFVFGFSLVALEVGFIFAYKAGWQVSTASIVQAAFLAIALIFVGFILYHEPLSWNKIAGIVICIVGLIFINWK